jgi:xanthine dehydrogenase accessory factor
MSRPDVQARAAELRGARSPYVHARVVLAERPTSAKPGDEALVLPDGTIEGFVGGSCAETTVRAQGLAALGTGESVLLRITPLPEPDQPGKVTVVNACLSGGTFEVFLEPVVPAPMVTVVGETPIARALARLGEALGYEVRAYATDLLPATSAVVVASHGRDEEEAVTAAVRAGVPYVGLVASRRRGTAVLESLELTDEERASVHTPAGLDLGARTAEEVALSILAEVVVSRAMAGHRAVASSSAADGPTPTDPLTVGVAKDPVCGMDVVMSEQSLHLDHEGVRYWFCGTGCLRAFAADPTAYVGP